MEGIKHEMAGKAISLLLQNDFGNTQKARYVPLPSTGSYQKCSFLFLARWETECVWKREFSKFWLAATESFWSQPFFWLLNAQQTGTSSLVIPNAGMDLVFNSGNRALTLNRKTQQQQTSGLHHTTPQTENVPPSLSNFTPLETERAWSRTSAKVYWTSATQPPLGKGYSCYCFGCRTVINPSPRQSPILPPPLKFLIHYLWGRSLGCKQAPRRAGFEKRIDALSKQLAFSLG